MTITSVQLAAGLAKGCMTVLLATNAKELAAIQNSTGMTIMNNWPFPPATGAVPWTAKQIKEYAKQQRQQTEDAPL